MEQQVFDVKSAAEYLRTIGFSGASVNTVRRLISDKCIRSTLLGRKLYVSKDSLDHLVASMNRASGQGRLGAA